jgi:hypothetical protein
MLAFSTSCRLPARALGNGPLKRCVGVLVSCIYALALLHTVLVKALHVEKVIVVPYHRGGGPGRFARCHSLRSRGLSPGVVASASSPRATATADAMRAASVLKEKKVYSF